MMKVLCTRAVNCEAGATAIEYSLTAALVSMALYSGADRLGDALADQFQSLSNTIEIPADGQQTRLVRATGGTRDAAAIAAASQRMSAAIAPLP